MLNANAEIFGQVAIVMAHRVFKAVLLGVGVEVSAGGFEIGGFAKGLLVDVDGVVAFGQVLEVELDRELAALGFLEGSRSGVLARTGLKWDRKTLVFCCERGHADAQDRQTDKLEPHR